MQNLSINSLILRKVYSDFITMPMQTCKQQVSLHNINSKYLFKSLIKLGNTKYSFSIQKSQVSLTQNSAIDSTDVLNISNLKISSQNVFSYFSAILIDQCVFVRCYGDNGGAVCIPRDGVDPTVDLKRSSFSHCNSDKVGGALFVFGSRVNLSNVCISSSYAKFYAHSYFIEAERCYLNRITIYSCGKVQKQQHVSALSRSAIDGSFHLTYNNYTSNEINYQGAVLTQIGKQKAIFKYSNVVNNSGASLFNLQNNNEKKSLQVLNCQILFNRLTFAPFSATEVPAKMLFNSSRYLENKITKYSVLPGAALITVKAPNADYDDTIFLDNNKYCKITDIPNVSFIYTDINKHCFFVSQICNIDIATATPEPIKDNSKIINITLGCTIGGLFVGAICVYGIIKWRRRKEYQQWQMTYIPESLIEWEAENYVS